ncbi:MAG: permease [Planctomycetes bacterium]|jgi:uncharacterized membrane protein|nr:permease [Planctomycetota bacterium]
MFGAKAMKRAKAAESVEGGAGAGRGMPADLAVDLESDPLTRPEYISAIVHLYRGELHRANAWRMRLDNTTNWAILTTAALLTFSFGDGQHSHWTLLAGLSLVSAFLTFEARRFRLADVWRARVRMIEENFYGPLLRRKLDSPEALWGNLVADDLFRPKYKITHFQAIRLRLLRNYWPIYGVLLLAWCVHVTLMPVPAESWGEVRRHLSTGLIPWWVSLAYLGLMITGGLAIIFLPPKVPQTEMEHWSNPTLGAGENPILDG